MVETQSGKLYTGISTDTERRFQEHASRKKGAKFFSTSAPVKIVYREKQVDRAAACQRESEIKKMSRKMKLNLIQQGGKEMER